MRHTKMLTIFAAKRKQQMTMTIRHLNEVTRDTVEELGLGPASVRRSSAYHDYVALEFVLFVNPHATAIIERNFRKLCDHFGWECCRVTSSNSRAIFVTMHEREAISTGSRRMPD